MRRTSHRSFLEEAMAKPGVVKALNDSESEFKIYEELIRARISLGKT